MKNLHLIVYNVLKNNNSVKKKIFINDTRTKIELAPKQGLGCATPLSSNGIQPHLSRGLALIKPAPTTPDCSDTRTLKYPQKFP